MMRASQQFEIEQLRQENVVKMVESIAVFIFCIFTSSFLPQLIYKYFYANAQLLEQPPLFDYIQVGSFLVGVAYFAFGIIGNILRSRKIMILGKAVATSEDCCEGCNGFCTCDDHDNCVCGCQEESEVMSESTKESAVKMMKKAGGKRRSNRSK